MKNIGETPGVDRDYENNERSKQEQQSNDDDQRNKAKSVKGSAADIANLPEVDAPTRDLGTVSGVDK